MRMIAKADYEELLTGGNLSEMIAQREFPDTGGNRLSHSLRRYFLVLHLAPDEGEADRVFYRLRTLTENLPARLTQECAAVRFKDGLRVIRFTDRYSYFSEPEEETAFQSFLEKARCSAGMSYIHVAEESLSAADTQAAYALAEGRKTQRNTRLHRYSQMMILELAELASGAADLRPFIDPRMKMLIRSDCEEHTDYIRSLEEIIRYHGDSRETADHLYIHRNTLYYRARKLSEDFHIDLKDQGDFLTIRVSIAILLTRSGGVFSAEAFRRALEEDS